MLQDHEFSRIQVNTVSNHTVQNSELYSNEKVTQSICFGTIWRENSEKYVAKMTMENPIVINGFNFTDDAVNLIVTNQETCDSRMQPRFENDRYGSLFKLLNWKKSIALSSFWIYFSFRQPYRDSSLWKVNPAIFRDTGLFKVIFNRLLLVGNFFLACTVMFL